ncbi:alpha/beta-hydrolase [Auricularia subglabra TFB-10046 SS5]|nr:alpha/beta-hydrolase [Auricularia subglabra TFB-10046 SS5]
MFELPAWDAYDRRVGAFAVLVACALSYWLNRRLTRLHAVVQPAPEADVEKGAAVGGGGGPVATNPQPTSLILWAAIMFPLSIAMWCLPNIMWPCTKELSTYQRVADLFMGISPILASLQIMLCSYALSRPLKPLRAEIFRTYMRLSMISAAAMSPMSVVWAAWVFPERFYGSPLVFGAAVAYALQGCVWMYFVRRSKRESEETFDEKLDHLLTQGLPGGDVVNEVWTLDTVTQGEGGRINASELPDIFDWTENARDVLSFLIAYLPASPRASPPAVLSRLSDADIDLRRSRGFTERKLVALGHSQGGAAVALAACDVPSLFDSIILVDPVIVASTQGDPSYDVRVAAAAKRRDVWPSREEAMSALVKSPFFQRWHPAVLRAYVEHGLYTAYPSGEVRLKCTPYQEASSFTEGRAPVYAWHRLASLPARVALFWILAGGNENGVTGGDAGTPHTVWRRPENSRNVRVDGAGHLIVQQKPEALARLVSSFLAEKYAGAGAKARM